MSAPAQRIGPTMAAGLFCLGGALVAIAIMLVVDGWRHNPASWYKGVPITAQQHDATYGLALGPLTMVAATFILAETLGRVLHLSRGRRLTLDVVFVAVATGCLLLVMAWTVFARPWGT